MRALLSAPLSSCTFELTPLILSVTTVNWVEKRAVGAARGCDACCLPNLAAYGSCRRAYQPHLLLPTELIAVRSLSAASALQKTSTRRFPSAWVTLQSLATACDAPSKSAARRVHVPDEVSTWVPGHRQMRARPSDGVRACFAVRRLPCSDMLAGPSQSPTSRRLDGSALTQPCPPESERSDPAWKPNPTCACGAAPPEGRPASSLRVSLKTRQDKTRVRV